jgi:uncharacterized protein (TIGR02594 family)
MRNLTVEQQYSPSLGSTSVMDGFTTDINAPYTFSSSLPTQVFKVYAKNNATTNYSRIIGEKSYELNDHLGNVRVVISDRKYLADRDDNDNISTGDNFVPEVLSANEYGAFGSILPGRSFAGGGYRYGWGGHEKVDEIKGNGNHYTAEYWEYDPRTGRRWNIDPVYKHHLSNYSVMSGNPISRIDPNGADDGWVEDGETGELTWDENVNSQEEFDKSGYDKDKYSYAGQETQRVYSFGSTKNMNYTEYYGPDGSTGIYDYPNWLISASADIGLHEINDKAEVSKYTTYKGLNSDAGTFTFSDGVGSRHAWCGCFANYHLEESGYSGPEVNAASVQNWNGTWRTWESGTKITKPTLGAFVTLGDDHVGMVVGMSNDNILILGGNQGDKVSVMSRAVKSNYQFFLPINYSPAPLDSDKGYLQNTNTLPVENINSVR